MKAVLGTLAAVVLLAVISFGAWKLYWVGSESATNQRTKINLQSYGAQVGARDALVRKVSDIKIAEARNDDPTVIEALKVDACQVASRLTVEGSQDLPVSVNQFVSQEC